MGGCPSSCFGLRSVNTNDLPCAHDHKKNGALFQDTIDRGIDIAVMQEAGINWAEMPCRHCWQARLDQKFQCHKSKTHFKHDECDQTGNWQQWGGTGAFTHGKLCHCSMGAGGDKANLGRWTWARHQGKGGLVLRVVGTHIPGKSNLAGSAWQQQKLVCRHAPTIDPPAWPFLKISATNCKNVWTWGIKSLWEVMSTNTSHMMASHCHSANST